MLRRYMGYLLPFFYELQIPLLELSSQFLFTMYMKNTFPEKSERLAEPPVIRNKSMEYRMISGTFSIRSFLLFCLKDQESGRSRQDKV